MFPKDLRNDVSIVSTVLSVEQDNLPEFGAMMGTAIAIAISDIPFNGPVASVFVGIVDGEFVINPTAAQREVSQLNMTVSGTRQKVCMIEAGAKEVPDDVMFDAIMLAHEEIKKLCDFVDEIADAVGKKEKEKKLCSDNLKLHLQVVRLLLKQARWPNWQTVTVLFVTAIQ